MTISDEYAALDAELAGPDPEYDAEVPAAPGDPEGVNRALRRLARHHRERDAVTAVHQAELDRVRDRLDARLEIVDKAIAWEEEGLGMYHRARLADDPTAKTLHLPSGTLKSRGQQPAWAYDDVVFIAWAERHRPDLVRTPEPKPEVDKAAAKKVLVVPALAADESGPAVTVDGEVVPGVTVTVRGPSFSVDFGEDG